jgi:hypothetical protein
MEAVKDGVELEVPALGVTQVKQAGLKAQPPGTHPQREGTRVVLHLSPGLIGHPLAAQVPGRADAQVAQLAGQGGVFDGDAVLFPEFFRDALGKPLHSWELAKARIDDLNRRRANRGIWPAWAIIRRTALRLSLSPREISRIGIPS